jgi:hypothetical protein
VLSSPFCCLCSLLLFLPTASSLCRHHNSFWNACAVLPSSPFLTWRLSYHTPKSCHCHLILEMHAQISFFFLLVLLFLQRKHTLNLTITTNSYVSVNRSYNFLFLSFLANCPSQPQSHHHKNFHSSQLCVQRLLLLFSLSFCSYCYTFIC